MNNTLSGYRADIDGLRAVAVLLVIFFHLGTGWFPGGYVGVDVFFVISGFLITKIIAAEIDLGKFTYASFYARRARRLFPALYVMIAAVLVGGLFFQLPNDFVTIGQTAISAVLFSANIYFWRNTDYFSPEAEFNPLLHTWSLSVEEQFYLVVPVFLLLLARFKAPKLPFLAAAAVASFVLSVVSIQISEWAAYYLLPSRAWQLLCGSLLALSVTTTGPATKLSEAGGWVGIAAILWASLMFSSQTPYPGVAGLFPTLGTAAVIYAGGREGSGIGRLIGNPIMVAIGLASYSLYLWHWPVLAFLRAYQSSAHLGAPAQLLAFALTMVLGFASWRFVEQPFRNKKVFSDGSIGRLAVGCSAALLVCAVVVIGASGFPERMTEDGRRSASLAPELVLRDPCLGIDPDQVAVSACYREGQRSGIVLYGDSHAAALAQVKNTFAGRSIGFVGRVGCPPLLGVRRLGYSGSALCTASVEKITELLANDPSVHTVIINSRWALAAEGTRFGGEGGSLYRLVDDEQQVAGEDNHDVVARGLERTLDRLLAGGKKVLLVGPVPEVGANVPKTMARRELAGTKRDIRPETAAFFERQRETLAILEKASERPGVEVFYPHAEFCGDLRCDIEKGGKPLYLDDDHVSETGAWLVAEGLAAQYPELLR
ncbi:acyltransferase family protein [Parvularcula maris]|uniref:Acyltransferase n=1 Tax=Parvularcula maris TaxID=2965077 RepID=A0A9X2LBH7_9PROT|nr:acyltransferase family protein [Parvularcula maris]MCQ8186655.1 acyltransferase [Parvularcula maris]